MKKEEEEEERGSKIPPARERQTISSVMPTGRRPAAARVTAKWYRDRKSISAARGRNYYVERGRRRGEAGGDGEEPSTCAGLKYERVPITNRRTYVRSSRYVERVSRLLRANTCPFARRPNTLPRYYIS